MPRLLACPSEPAIPVSCCEKPYVHIHVDCLEACLNEELLAASVHAESAIRRLLRFGTEPCKEERFLQDLHFLRDHLLAAFREMVVRTRNGATNATIASIREDYELACIERYMSERHGLDVRSWLARAGLVNPDRPPRQPYAPFPFMDEPCHPDPDCPEGPGFDLPVPVLQLYGPPNLYLLYSGAIAGDSSGFTGQLQLLVDGAWVNALPPLPVPMDGVQVNVPFYDFTAFRVLYRYGGCEYFSLDGEVVPASSPCPVANFFALGQGDLDDIYYTWNDGIYYMTSDSGDLINTLPLLGIAIGDLVGVDGTYVASPQVGDVIYLDDPGGYFEVTSPGVLVALHPAVTLTQSLTAPFWTLQSPTLAPSIQTSFVIVEAYNGVEWVFIWAGPASDMESGAGIGMLLFVPEEVRVTYFPGGECAQVIDGDVVLIGDDPVSITCGDGIEYGMWTYPGPSNTPFGILFTVTPLFETLTMTFAGGTITDEITVLFYDGIGGTQIGSISSPTTNAQGFQIVSTGPQLYVVFGVADGAPVPQPQPFWWQIVCTQGSSPLTVSAVSVDDCNEWEFNVNVTVASTGDGPSITLEVTLDGVLQPDVTGVGVGVTSLGPYPIGSEVIINAVDLTNPDNSILMGAYYGGDTCLLTDDPCSPEVGYKVNGLGDLIDLPVDPGLPAYGYFVTSDTTGIGTWPVGSLLGWDDGAGTWFSVGYTPGIIISDGITFWIAQGPGFQPYNVFPTPVLNPTGILPNNWTLWIEDIGVYNITTNRPISLETRSGFGPWTQQWTGTEQQLLNPHPISITGTFTQARIVWNHDTCGFVGGVIIEALPWE